MLQLLARMIIAFAAILVVIRVVGAQSKHPLADMFTEITLANGQKQVCWHNICPGVTTSNEAQAILNADTAFTFRQYWQGQCWIGSGVSYDVCLGIRDSQIDRLDLSYAHSPAFQFGDLILSWGNPQKSIVAPECVQSDNLFGNNVVATIYSVDLQFHKRVQIYPIQLEVESRVYDIVITASTTKIDFSHLELRQRSLSFQGNLIGCAW